MKSAQRITHNARRMAIILTLIIIGLVLPQAAQAAAPVANDQALTINEDTSVNITLTASDADGDSLTYFVVTKPAHGSLSNLETGTNKVLAQPIKYTPKANYNGTDAFTFKANDGTSDSNTATVSLTINPVNDAPTVSSIPNPITFAIKPEETSVTKTYTLPVTDVDKDSLTYSVVGLPLGASFNTQTGEITWTITHQDIRTYPNITFTASDGQLQSSKTVTMEIRKAKTYYCDPNGNTPTGDGSAEHPWGTLESICWAGKFNGVIIQSGDTVKLKTGFHGAFPMGRFFGGDKNFNGPSEQHLHFTDFVTIEPDTGAVADVNFIYLENAYYMRFRGLRVSPSFSNQVTPNAFISPDGNAYMIYIMNLRCGAGYNQHIIVEDCNIFTLEDSVSDSWTPYDWNDLAYPAVRLGCTHCIFRNNYVHNVGGVVMSIDGSYSDVNIAGNKFDRYHGEGLLCPGSDITIQDNIITNLYANRNPGIHADVIQTQGNTINNNRIIRRNYICSNTNPNRLIVNENIVKGTDAPNLYYCTAQHYAAADTRPITGPNWRSYWALYTGDDAGETWVEGAFGANGYHPRGAITQGMFLAGTFNNLLIENNVIMVDHGSYGIVFRNDWTTVTNAKILNNTILMPSGLTPGGTIGWPDIGGFSGVPASDIIIRNNIADGFPPSDPTYDIVVDHNLDIDSHDPNDEFVSYVNDNVHLAANSNFIDAGSSSDAPTEDLDRNSRPQGQGYDVGAYEYGTSTTSLLYGDVNSDGEVSAYDAALAAHIAVELEHPDIKNRAAADVNGDSEVSAYDAALIAQRAVGLIEKFPVEE